MRLFTAIDLSEEARANIESLLLNLKPAAKLQWSPAANLHITTKFIGDWPESRLDELNAALTALPAVGPIEIAVRQVGWFPNSDSPRSFWVGVQATPALQELAMATNAAMLGIGVVAETRPYSPHLTLARIRKPEPLEPLRQAIAALPTLEFGSFTASRYHLYVSELSSGGSVYTKLADYSLLS